MTFFYRYKDRKILEGGGQQTVRYVLYRLAELSFSMKELKYI